MEYSYRRDGLGAPIRLSGPRSRVGGINWDGSVVVGGQQVEITPFGSLYAASRWTESGGFQTLIDPDHPSIFWSMASGVSADGNTVVGTYFDNADGFATGFKWTPDRGVERLPNPTGRADYYAADISSDGRRIVGTLNYPDGTHNVMWMDGTVIDMGRSTPMTGEPNAVSNTGLVILDNRQFDVQATVWSAELGRTVTLFDYIESFGIDVPDNWVLFDAVSVSDDGRTIAGSAFLPDRHYRGFVVTVPGVSSLSLLAGAACVLRRRRS